MKKIFTLAAAVLASLSLFAAAEDLNFSEPTELPEGYVYSTKNTPIIATVGDKSSVYVTNGGGGSVVAACFTEEGLDASKGQRWMGFVNDDDGCTLVINVYSNKKAFTLYNDKAEAQATFTNADKAWEDWTIENLPAGKYILTAASSQCYVSAMTFSGGAPSTDPVTEITVSGPTTGVVGIPVTFVAKAKKATSIWWTDKYGTKLSENGTLVLTPEAAGEFTYTAWAENEFNEYPVTKEHTITISDKLCGELIKATHTGGKTATVEGVIGGTADKNTASDGKFGGKGQFFGITLASGAFLAGDELNVHTTKAAEQGSLAIYADKAGETLLFYSESMGVEGDNIIVLPAALNEKSTLYICRTETNTWNGYVDFIAVNRACGASNNADVSEVRVNGVVVEPEGEKGTLYNYTLGASYSEPTVSIALTLAHPKATIKYGLDNPYEMGTPDAGSSKGQAFTIVAEDGVTEKTITVNVAKSATLSNNWFLSELSIDGYTLDPAFTPENNEYNITKPYGAANPTESDIHAVTQHPGATIQSIDINPTSILIMVMAENGVSSNGYVIWIQEAAAKKDLLEVSFSNGVHGFITAGNIDVPFLEGEAEPSFVSATFWEPDGEPKAEMVDGKLVVTGIDGQQAEYTITYHAITPMEYSTEEVVFDAVPSYIYSVYEFDADKGVKFAKDVEEAKNHRISEGKDRIYIALPAANKVLLTSGTGAKRPVKILVNGEESAVAQTAASDEAIEIILSKEHANFVAIESNGSNGDGGFIKLQLSEESGQGIEDLDASEHAVKFLQNGQILIRRGEKIFTVTGQEK